VTEIKELSSSTLNIIYKRSWFNRIINLIPTVLFLALAIYILIWGRHEVPTGEFSAFAPAFLVLLAIGLLVGGLFFLSSVFDAISYHFDKTEDKFHIKGRRYFLKRWAVEGLVSEIISISCEIYGQDEHTNSEIYVKYYYYGTVTETLKCGTGEVSEDSFIADIIETFLRPENKR